MQKGRENKPHIGIFGKRNNGKSSFINALAGQDTAIVSETPGTTTDPVKKSMEISKIGPVIIIDTAGIDDSGTLGEKRIAKSMAAIDIIDLAILVITDDKLDQYEESLVDNFTKYNTPFVIVHNKSDIFCLNEEQTSCLAQRYNTEVVNFSCIKPDNKEQVINVLRKAIPANVYNASSILSPIVSKNDLVLLITPIDSGAPEGRMILPQVQMIRDVLDNDAICVVAKETEVENLIKTLCPKPKLAITDSQVFEKANRLIPDDILLTSFSTVLARYKGNFSQYLQGTKKISQLVDNDKVLILESCTHHASCEDIGRVKLPTWLKKFTGKKLEFDIVAGLNDLPHNLESYALVIQCGGCVVTKTQLQKRLQKAIDAKVAVTNYGMAIAWMHGIYERAIEPFKDVT